MNYHLTVMKGKVMRKGDIVKIINPPYQGKLGTIIRRDGSEIMVKPEGIKHEIQLYIEEVELVQAGPVTQLTITSDEVTRVMYSLHVDHVTVTVKRESELASRQLPGYLNMKVEADINGSLYTRESRFRPVHDFQSNLDILLDEASVFLRKAMSEIIRQGQAQAEGNVIEDLEGKKK